MATNSRIQFVYVLAILFCALSYATSVNAQQNNWWYFGNQVSIDFNSGTAVAGTGSLVGAEGTASASDSNGNLRFYTDGLTIWNQNHTVMPNGSGLLGGVSSSQAALIVPKPGSCETYYVFTTEDHNGQGTFRYSRVDMCLDNGLGDVVTSEKNILLSSPTGEKITAIRHANGVDVWVVTHGLQNDQFLAFLVTSSGVVATPVVSAVGSVHASNHMIGPIKASHDGTKLVATLSFGSMVEMFDFNSATGAVSNMVDLDFLYNIPLGAYGVEFSPNDDILYISTFWGTNRLMQIDLVASTVITLDTQIGNYEYGALQLGPDGRIYLCRRNQPFMDVINDPNISGVGCNHVAAGFNLAAGTTCDSGLPNFVPYSFVSNYHSVAFDLHNDTTLCGGDSLVLDVTLDCSASVVWNDGTTDTSNVISQSGIYWATVTNSCASHTDSVTVNFNQPATNVDLGNDTTICFGDSLLLLASGVSGSWQNGSTADSFWVSSAGTYYFSDNAGNCINSDTIVVSQLAAPPVINLGPDLTICDGDSATLQSGLPAVNLQWNTGAMSSNLTVVNSGTYWVSYTDQCVQVIDTVVVQVIPVASFDLGPDTTICLGDSLLLVVSSAGPWTWQDNSTDSTFLVTSAGTYFVTVGHPQCAVSDTITVFQSVGPSPLAQPDTALCDGSSWWVDYSSAGATSVVWQDGFTGALRELTSANTYVVSMQQGCVVLVDTFVVTITPYPLVDLGPDLTICPTDTITLGQDFGSHSVSWSTGSSEHTLEAFDEGTYVIYVADGACVSTDTVELTAIPLPTVDLGPDIVLCEDSVATLYFSDQGNAASWIWNNGGTDSMLLIDEAGTYGLLASNICGSSGDSITVSTVFCNCALYVPNAFTPNEDMINDDFGAESVCPFDVLTLRIWNRWGELIFEGEDLNERWDGTYLGGDVPDGVYIWQIQYQYGQQPEKDVLRQRVGHVTVLR